MNILKLIAGTIGGFILTIGATFFVWYSAPDLKLSFFASGSGNPLINIDYSDINSNNHSTPLYLELSDKPQLVEVILDTDNLNNLKFNISNYNGNILFSDVFISGNHFQNLQPLPAENLNISESSANYLNFSMSGNVSVPVCNANIPAKAKQLNFFYLGLISSVYFALIAFAWVIYRLREKVKNKLLSVYTLKNYALIYPYVKPYLGRAILAIVITIPVGSMDAVIAWSLKPFMDVVLVEKQTGWTMYIPLMIVIFSVLQALFTYIATYMNSWVGNRISLDVKRKLFNKLMHSDASFFDKGNSGEVLFRFNNDAEVACSNLLNNMKLFTTRFFSSISLIAVLFYNSWQLAIIAVVVLFGALYPLTKTRKRLKKVVSKDANALATLLTHYNEAYSGNRIISAYNLFDFCKKKFIDSIENIFDLGIQMIKKTAIIAPIMHVISSLGIAFVIWYGSYLIVNHEITVGNFASFITSLVMLYNPIKSIGNSYNGVIFSLMAVDRIFEVLNRTVKICNCKNPKFLTNCKGNISYKNVCFGYVKNKQVLKNINIDIKAGQTIALVGNSGGGKTTISTLLPRFYDVTSGSIKIDNVDIREVDLKNLRDNISIVFQDNFLFVGSIRDNILFNRTDVSEETLNEAVKAACLEDFIASLENGLDTEIGEQGVLLSGGQKQRIAIARAFIKNAPILILDEATSALDNKSEAVVQQAIENLMKDRTVLVIAHRLSTVRNADKIIVINNGMIVEQGSHDELLKIDGAYSALYKTQLA